MTLASLVKRESSSGTESESKLKPLSHELLESRVRALQEQCKRDKSRWTQKYGKRNLAMARTHEGSRARLRDMVRRTILGEELIVSAIGGSVTNGHQVDASETWLNKLTDWFNTVVQASENGWKGINGAVPATGSDYFSFCHALHIPTSISNLIIIELSVNDEFLPEHTENMENLLRGILESPNRPAVILVQAMALSGRSMAGGGDVHMPVGVYYDVPIITQRNPLAAHFMKNPDLVHPYYTINWWQDPDTRHINARGHQDLANLVASLVQDTACELHFKTQPSVPLYPASEFYGKPFDIQEQRELVAEDDEFWQDQPKDVKPWGPFQPAKHAEGESGRLWEGVWPGDWQHGEVPRLRFLQHWDEGTTNVPLEPQCFSTRSTLYPLTPNTNSGWSTWSHPDRPQKVYLKADEPGSKLTFDIETRLGTIKLYSLRSKTFGLGSIDCWVDDREEDKVRADGWWDNGDLNIGRFTTVATGLAPGMHTVTCVLSSETLDPDGGTEFRLISLMRRVPNESARWRSEG
ncbi:hypothetical protein HD553DRAFT_266702 [Filobasidium floriforme]|uniref:uncharacterized protein n=1 Tax=Filobasidium floriforme TaxID=5210 RepID=UPI001E8D9CD5|nr:uncharacterized protein HD553DRAFT_266702 [Filobasidium floriforme]KAH8090423.1 hypothetical protein HD553DRAFT_266702 [Filobasidium floriforme]